jgi:hypothetical protein
MYKMYNMYYALSMHYKKPLGLTARTPGALSETVIGAAG